MATTAVRIDDPLSVAGAVATALYDTALYDTGLYDTALYDTGLYDTALYDTALNREIQPLLSSHARRMVEGAVQRNGRRSTAAVTAEQLLDPKASAVVVQLVVTRWWLDGKAQVCDNTPHLVRVTLWRGPGGRWMADDIEAIS